MRSAFLFSLPVIFPKINLLDSFPPRYTDSISYLLISYVVSVWWRKGWRKTFIKRCATAQNYGAKRVQKVAQKNIQKENTFKPMKINLLNSGYVMVSRALLMEVYGKQGARRPVAARTR